MTGERLPRWIDYLPLADLTPAAENPKGHDLPTLRASIERFGLVEVAAVEDGRTGRVISGHGRLEDLAAAEVAGLEPPEGVTIADDGRWRVPVLRGWSSADDTEAEAALVAVNETTIAGGWVERDLAPLLDRVAKSRRGLEGTGWQRPQLSDLLRRVRAKDIEQAARDAEARGDAPEVAPAVTQLGSIWTLGPHRLVCGDSLDPDVQAEALQGKQPGSLFTDPPYGMNLETDFSKIHKGHGGAVYEPVEGDDRPFDASPIIARYDKVPEQWWWGADYYRETIEPGGSWVVWDKRGRDGEGVFDAVHGNHFELCWSRQAHRREIARILWVGNHRLQAEDVASRIHPTQKPTNLVRWFFARWVAEASLVFDPFAGSGSTLIACAQTGRRCATIELSPTYCDLIAARFQHMTGVIPLLNGQPADQLAGAAKSG